MSSGLLKYALMKRNVQEGIISIHSKGFGFVNIGMGVDIYVPAGATDVALTGDTVKIETTTRGGRKEGRVLRVLKRRKTQFVGAMRNDDKGVFFVPDDTKIHVDFELENANGARVGDKIVVELRKWTSPDMNPLCSLVRIIGKVGEHETEIQSIIIKNGIVYDFPLTVQNEARTIKTNEFKIFAEAESDRERADMRDRITFTIDPKTAKDFDDALSLRKNDDGTYEIGVHIADVSHYVKPGSAIDEEARIRGFSTYLVDRTVPMLPEELSNDLCSLNPNVDRLAFSAILTMDKEGAVLNAWFGKTLIHSDRRFTYEDAQLVISSGKGDYTDELVFLNVIAKKLRSRRFNDGAIDFSDDEVEFELGALGEPIKIKKKERLDTHKLVEEFMLLANKYVAKKIYELSGEKDIEHLFVYRVHDLPDRKKLDELAVFVRALGHTFAYGEDIAPREINTLLDQVRGTAEEGLVNTALIRSMAKAAYSTKNKGHFGLAFEYYSHFTSPIRRYPDLMVHRLLYAHIHGRQISHKELAIYEQATLDSSEKEKTVMDAERESIRYKQVEYMQNHIGEIFNGLISGVGEYGFYVEENTTKAQGMVSLKSLKNDYYSLNEKKYSIVGERTGRKFTVGDAVKIRLAGADIQSRQLDFEIV